MFPMHHAKTISLVMLVLSSVFFVTACATKVVEVPAQIKPSKVKLSQYTNVVLVKAEISATYAKHPANIKAANKIDEILHQKLSAIYPNIQIKTVDESKLLTQSNEKVLVIKPKIKQIKFIGGAARFWAGAMAGSSVVIMDTAFIDLSTGEQLANPGYLRKAGAYTDPFGIGSNDMLEQIAADVANYVAMSQ